MDLIDLGYNDDFESFRLNNNLQTFEVGRVVAEHKERYVVKTTKNEFDAEITGNMRFTAKSREDFPAVGDWVALIAYESDFAIIHAILPRFSVIKRQAVAHFGEIQIIAANIDYAFIVQSVDRDYNINRIERYLTICNSSKVNPLIILTKTDLITEERLSEIMESIKKRIKDIPVIAISNELKVGLEKVKSLIKKGKTYCMLGSSGVGKSTLLNNLAQKEIMKTDTISQSANRGKHITSHRELIVLESGGLLIDNPGMREVGIADSASGLEKTFDQIIQIAQQCKFADCKHINETGCAVLEAVENGTIDHASYENYLKMEREKTHFESSVAEKRKKDKAFGKILKDYYKKDIKQKR
ncbi:MAG: ribosome small subunit-dependent GTPase A [Bacteroidales bacterium]|jgi:ribosome biogenesis GTPase|nr:ribosome small subunit-dependent GTPase A [Bacteroidales bacterium]